MFGELLLICVDVLTFSYKMIASTPLDEKPAAKDAQAKTKSGFLSSCYFWWVLRNTGSDDRADWTNFSLIFCRLVVVVEVVKVPCRTPGTKETAARTHAFLGDCIG